MKRTAYAGLNPCDSRAAAPQDHAKRIARCMTSMFAAGALLGCGESATLSVAEGTGPRPELPEPKQTLLPTVNIAPAVGWPQGTIPRAAPGLQVAAFASGLDHPRWLLVLPNGDVLVAESNAPPKTEGNKGIKQYVMARVMKRAGAGVPSANRISLLRDADGDGVAETRSVLLGGLYSPFGMALIGDRLFVANADAVLAFPYRSGDTVITAAGAKLVDLPGGPINHHWTKNLLASSDGSKLYVSVGSNSNVAERGLAAEAGRAGVWRLDLATGALLPFATGLRNPNGLALEPGTGALWTVVNERDELGPDLVPDYLAALPDGAFFGWPWSYWGDHVDTRVQPSDAAAVARARVPDYALGSHVAPLGLAWAGGNALGSAFAEGMFVGLHGSWNRRPRSGYQVVFVPFDGGRPTDGVPVEVLGGFVDAAGQANGRPVGVALDRTGALLVADDVGDTVWRVSAQRSVTSNPSNEGM